MSQNGFIFPNFRGENIKKYLSCHNLEDLCCLKPENFQELQIEARKWFSETPFETKGRENDYPWQTPAEVEFFASPEHQPLILKQIPWTESIILTAFFQAV